MSDLPFCMACPGGWRQAAETRGGETGPGPCCGTEDGHVEAEEGMGFETGGDKGIRLGSGFCRVKEVRVEMGRGSSLHLVFH